MSNLSGIYLAGTGAELSTYDGGRRVVTEAAADTDSPLDLLEDDALDFDDVTDGELDMDDAAEGGRRGGGNVYGSD